MPAHADSIDPGAAAQQFYAFINAQRAAAGVPALQWRSDIAAMAVAHSADMAAQGTIWHGSFVSEPNLKALNASLLAENVGMGGDVDSIDSAFMASEHHRENILDPGLNQVGTGVVIAGDGTVYVTEDFLHSKSGSAAPAAAPAPVPAAPKPAAPKPVSRPAPRPAAPRVAAAHPVAAAAVPVTPATMPTTAAPAPAPVGVVNAVPFAAAPASASANPSAGVLSNVFDGDVGMWTAMFGVLLLVFAVSGPAALRRRRLA